MQKALSGVPKGDRANYWLQRRVSKQMPRSDEHFLYQAGETLRHLQAWQRHRPSIPFEQARLYEFGAGWDLTTPLIFYGLGATQQTLVDIRLNLRFEDVDHSISQYERHRGALEQQSGRPLRDLGSGAVRSIDDLQRRFGIVYLAPCDARNTGLPEKSFDLVSSTNTLEHIPGPDIAAILSEARRLLSADGIVSGLVDMQDHYSYFDPSVSAFNFFRFSDRTWAAVNSSLHYQNRLRVPDYRDLIQRAGLELVEEQTWGPTAADLDTIRAMRLASRFAKRYSVDDLATRAVHIISRRPVAAELV